MWGISCPRGNLEPRTPEYVSFAELFDATAEPDESATGHRRRRNRHRRPHEVGQQHQPRARTWVCLAEWVLGGWARTLRAGALMALVVIAVGAVTSAMLGIYGGAAVAALLALLQVLTSPRRRTALN